MGPGQPFMLLPRLRVVPPQIHVPGAGLVSVQPAMGQERRSHGERECGQMPRSVSTSMGILRSRDVASEKGGGCGAAGR